jgi:hypothetical protein
MSQSITVATGTDLFHLAAQYLGDATLWLQIAQANGFIVDPVIIGTQTLIIPQADPTQTGGVAQQ